MNDARLLLIEDQPGHADALADFLRAAGYAVHRVDAGPRAISAAYDVRPDLALFDVAVDVQRALSVASTLAWVDDLSCAVVCPHPPAPETPLGRLLARVKAWLPAPPLDGRLLRRLGALVPQGDSWSRR